MRKKMLLKKGVSFVAVAVSVMFLWVAFSAAVVECPDDIVINTEGWPKDKYEPTTLSHKKHATEYKIPCKDCHHVYEDGKNVWEEAKAPSRSARSATTCTSSARSFGRRQKKRRN